MFLFLRHAEARGNDGKEAILLCNKTTAHRNIRVMLCVDKIERFHGKPTHF